MPPDGRAETHAPPPAQPRGSLLATIERIAEASARPAELSRLYTTIVDEAGALIRASVAITLLETDTEILRLRAGSGTLSSQEGALLPVEGSFAGRALVAEGPTRTSDLRSDPATYPLERQTRSGPAAAVPLIIGQEILGVLMAVREPGEDSFEDADLRDLEYLGRIAASGLAAARRFAEARGDREAVDVWRREQSLRSQLEWCTEALGAGVAVSFGFDTVTEQMTWGGTADHLGDLTPEEPITLDEWLEKIHPEDREEVAHALRGPDMEPARLRIRAERDPEQLLQLDIGARGPRTGRSRIGILRYDTGAPDSQVASPPTREIIQAVRHELNNPLAIILGELQLLQRDEGLQGVPSVAQVIETVNEAALRMSELASRLAAAERQAGSLFITEKGGIGVRS